jgi:hypothetical protein
VGGSGQLTANELVDDESRAVHAHPTAQQRLRAHLELHHRAPIHDLHLLVLLLLIGGALINLLLVRLHHLAGVLVRGGGVSEREKQAPPVTLHMEQGGRRHGHDLHDEPPISALLPHIHAPHHYAPLQR